MRVGLIFLAVFAMLEASAQTVVVGKYSSREELSKVFLANLRTIPNTQYTLRSSDKTGGTIQAVRLIRNQELASLFVLVTQQNPTSVLIEATFTKNGGWFGGGVTPRFGRNYGAQLKSLLPDLIESAETPEDASQLERVVPLRLREEIALGITSKRVTIDSAEITGWPKAEGIRKAGSDPESTSKIVVVLTYSNRGNADWKCEYVVSVLDDKDEVIGSGRRMVSLDEGEIGDSHRVGVTMRTADFSRATKLRVQVVDQ